MTATALAVALGSVAMLVITACSQLRKPGWAAWLKNHDACAYIPTWTFFAPNPGVNDTRVLWREQLSDGSVSHWHEVVPPSSRLLRAVWNPSKRARKAVTDCGPMVVRLVSANKGSKLPLLSLPYLMLIQYISGLPGSPLGLARQFTVLNTQGPDELDGPFRLLFVSHWHRLPSVPRDAPLLARSLPELDPALEEQLAEPWAT
ncbi:MAG: hypothetical protein ACOH1Y_04130 [Propionicimonas sp.]